MKGSVPASRRCKGATVLGDTPPPQSARRAAATRIEHARRFRTTAAKILERADAVWRSPAVARGVLAVPVRARAGKIVEILMVRRQPERAPTILLRRIACQREDARQERRRYARAAGRRPAGTVRVDGDAFRHRCSVVRKPAGAGGVPLPTRLLDGRRAAAPRAIADALTVLRALLLENGAADRRDRIECRRSSKLVGAGVTGRRDVRNAAPAEGVPRRADREVVAGPAIGDDVRAEFDRL